MEYSDWFVSSAASRASNSPREAKLTKRPSRWPGAIPMGSRWRFPVEVRYGPAAAWNDLDLFDRQPVSGILKIAARSQADTRHRHRATEREKGAPVDWNALPVKRHSHGGHDECDHRDDQEEFSVFLDLSKIRHEMIVLAGPPLASIILSSNRHTD